ncbi:MAG: membrane protease YdiL (CAAX protease family) [Limisphaerales bacterium]|jgi:membrane protease YdiL (CAAX protease family)
MASSPILQTSDLDEIQDTLFNASEEDLKDRSVLLALKVVNICAHLAKLAGVMLFFFLIGRHPLRNMGEKEFPPITILALALAAILASGPLISLVQEWNMAIPFPANIADMAKDLEEQATRYSSAMIARAPWYDMVLTFFLVVVLASVWEEIVFRGLVQRMVEMSTKNKHFAVWVAAIMFSAIHFQFLSFLPRMLLGVILGYLYLYSRQLWVPILAHAFNNGALLIFAWLTAKDPTQETELATFPMNYIYGLTSFMAVSGILYLVYRFYNGKRLGTDIHYHQGSSGGDGEGHPEGKPY